MNLLRKEMDMNMKFHKMGMKVTNSDCRSLRTLKQRIYLKSVKSSVERSLKEAEDFYNNGCRVDLLELFREGRPGLHKHSTLAPRSHHRLNKF